MLNDKQIVAIAAAKYVEDGMLVGLGTGSTANYFIEELARRMREERLKITTVASSTISAQYAQSCQLPLKAIEHIHALDIYVDGADEIAPNNTVLKGRGSDLVKEKLLARGATQFIVVADHTKLVGFIGEKNPIPIEVTPFAWQLVKHRLAQLGATPVLRPNAAGDGFWVTSHGCYVLDTHFAHNPDSLALNTIINNVPGIVAHGIFEGLATTVLVADNGKVTQR